MAYLPPLDRVKQVFANAAPDKLLSLPDIQFAIMRSSGPRYADVTVRKALAVLLAEGAIQKMAHGLYALPTYAEEQPDLRKWVRRHFTPDAAISAATLVKDYHRQMGVTLPAEAFVDELDALVAEEFIIRLRKGWHVIKKNPFAD